ncbi:MAG TPA: hypothetical protein VMH91_02165 [Candidatus Paceibacterota bacterium]|nr:hypothetical protein [Candidatus Paceibacterota bacterium]
MNSRAFLGFLVVVIVALVLGWFFFVYPRSATTPGEEATTTATEVTTAASQEPTTTTPSPTLDPGTVTANIVGNWVSTTDSNYTVQITAGDKWTDTYKGSDKSSASLSGTYTLFTSAHPDKDFTGVLVPGVVYLKVVEGRSTLYYSVVAAGGNELQLSYLDRGNTLSFVKVQ